MAVLGISAIIFVRRRRRGRADRGIRVDLMDDGVKPGAVSYAVPYDINLNHPLPPVPPGVDPVAPFSKFRPAVQHRRVEQGTKSGSLPSSSEHPATSTSSIHTSSLPPTGSSASGSVVPSTQAVTTSLTDAQDRVTPQPHANSEVSQESAREEDAGVVLDPEEVPASRSLPPAYNPDWDNN
jgi:hypothetical protein